MAECETQKRAIGGVTRGSSEGAYIQEKRGAVKGRTEAGKGVCMSLIRDPLKLQNSPTSQYTIAEEMTAMPKMKGALASVLAMANVATG